VCIIYKNMSSAARKTLTTTGLATAAVLLPGAMSKNPKPFNYKGPISTAPASIVESKMPTIGMPSVPKKPDPMVKIGRKFYNPDVADQIKEQTRMDDRWDEDKKMGGRRRRRRSTKRRSTKRRRRATKKRK
jgi:hypothetical protein